MDNVNSGELKVALPKIASLKNLELKVVEVVEALERSFPKSGPRSALEAMPKMRKEPLKV